MSPNVMSWRVLHSALVDLPGGDPLPAVRTTIGITDITNPSLFVVGYQTPPVDVPITVCVQNRLLCLLTGSSLATRVVELMM